MGAPRTQIITEDRASGAQIIAGSLKFQGGSVNTTKKTTLQRTPTTVGNGATWTFSVWLTRGYPDSSPLIGTVGGDDVIIQTYIDRIRVGGDSLSLDFNPQLRDYGSFYHICVAFDSHQSTNTNRVKYWINGTQFTDINTQFNTETWPTQNSVSGMFSANQHEIGGRGDNDSIWFDGQMSDLYLVDGQALEPTEFGYTDPLTNTWRPKKYSGAALPNTPSKIFSANYAASDSFQATAPKLSAFDGNITSRSACSSSGCTVTVSSMAVTVNSKLEVYAGYGSASVNGGTAVSFSGSAVGWQDLSFTGTLNTLAVTGNSSGGNANAGEIYAIRVDGVILVDGGGYGINGSYLPFDGSAPIGQDQSGRGNDWTPTNFGGSSVIPKATGAAPILNTISGGNVAVPGVRGQAGIAVTVYNSGSGNKYYLDGVEAGTVSFVPGQNITFDTSNSTVSGHPFRLSGTADGSHNAFYSVDFDGTGDYLTIPDSSDWDYGTGDFTVECWVMMTGGSGNRELFSRVGSGTFQFSVDGNNYPRLYHDGSNNFTTTHALQTNVWTHLAAVRKDGVFAFYIDGVKNISQAFTSNLDGSDGFGVAATEAGGQQFTGKISDLRVVKGTAVYTGNFAPPSTSLTNISGTVLLCCNQSTTTGSTVTPGTITANGDPTSSNDTPYDTYLFGTVTGASEGSAGAATTITLPSNAPSNLYYYCTNHSGMGGAISIGAIDSSVADPYASKCVFASPCVGVATDISAKVNCTTSTLLSLQANANQPGPAQVSQFYGVSSYYRGPDGYDYWYYDTGAGSKVAFGSNDFTIELWFHPLNLTFEHHMPLLVKGSLGANNAYDWRLYISSTNASNEPIYFDVDGGPSLETPAGFKLQEGRWYHVAICKDATNVRMYVDGNELDSAAWSGGPVDDDYVQFFTGYNNIGASGDTYYCGYLQDIRCYSGAAKYTSNFIPASTNPDLLPETPSGVAYSSELTKPTDGAVSFGQEAGYLTVAENADWDFGTGDYTAEAWVYMTGTDNYVFATLISGSWWGLNFWTNNSSWSIRAGYNSKHEYTKVEWNYRRWYHVAVARESGTSRLFLNGELLEQLADTDNLDSTGDLQVGRDANSWNKKFGGLISNARIVKGTALYTASFTPSSTPLTNVTNTKLLCCQSNSSAVNYAVSPGAITANGDAVASNFNPFNTDINTVLGKPTGYCTWNPLVTSGPIVTNGNLDSTSAANSVVPSTGTFGVSSGKWYWEVIYTGGTDGVAVGVTKNLVATSMPGTAADSWAYMSYSGKKNHDGTQVAYGIAFTPTGGSGHGTVVGVALDVDNRKIWWSVD